MSLDVYLTCEHCGSSVYDRNITHNLNKMADEAGIYEAVWRPEEIGATKARDIIERLRGGLASLKGDPARFVPFNAPNGWGLYEHLLNFVEEYLASCEENPDATISVSR